MNTQIAASLNIRLNSDILNIIAVAQNKTELTENISYKLSVIKTDIAQANESKNEQAGRQVIEAFQKVNLSQITVNTTKDDRIIVLLLIYDSNKKLIGTSRYVFNDIKDQALVKQELVDQWEKQVAYNDSIDEDKPLSKIDLKGIVVDETKTKAGKEFYQLYYSSYTSSGINSEYIIKVSETITMGNNTKISLTANGQTIFDFFVRTQYEYIKSMNDLALRMTIRHLENIKRDLQRTKIF